MKNNPTQPAVKVEQSVLFARRSICCEKSWEQYKKSWVVAMQMMQCLNAISKVKISQNLLLQFIYLDKATAEYQECYLWNTLKWGQRYFNGFPWVWRIVCVLLSSRLWLFDQKLLRAVPDCFPRYSTNRNDAGHCRITFFKEHYYYW